MSRRAQKYREKHTVEEDDEQEQEAPGHTELTALNERQAQLLRELVTISHMSQPHGQR